MKPQSAKAKGRKFQQHVRDTIRQQYPQLHPDDIQCTLMSEAGVDIKLSPAARQLFPYSVECKCQESLNIWAALEQAETNATPDTVPVVAFKRNRSKAYVAMPLDEFIRLTSIKSTHEGTANG